MKKYILLILLMLIVFAYNFMFRKNDRVIRIGVECDHAPYNWEENKSSNSNVPLVNNPGFYAEGYDVQIAKAIGEKIGANVVFYKVSFDELINALNLNEIDAIFSGMVDTNERKEQIDFTVTYEVRKTEYAAVVNSKSRYINAKSILDLEGARMIAQKNSRFDTVIDQIPNVIHLQPLDSQTSVIMEVINFNADGTVVNYDTGLSYEKTYPNITVIYFAEEQGFELGFTGLCAGIRKSDRKLLDEINYAIESISYRQRQRIMDNTIANLWKNLD